MLNYTIKQLFSAALPLIALLFIGCGDGPHTGDSQVFNELYQSLETLPQNDPSFPVLIDSLIVIAGRDDNNEEMVKALTRKAEYLITIEKNEEAIVTLNSAISLAEENGLSFLLGRNIENKGRALYRMMDRRKAIETLKRAASVYEAAGDSTGLGSALNNMGFIYWQESRFDSAIIYFNNSLEVRSSLKNNDHHATTLNNLGTIYFNWSLYDKALDYFMKSLDLQKAIDNAYGITISLSNIGQVYSETSQHEEAIIYYRESLGYAFKSQDTSVIGYAYQGLGLAYDHINLDSSGYYLKLSLDTYRETDDHRGIMLGLKGMGEHNLKQKNYEAAEIYFREMLDLAKEQNIILREAEALLGLGKVNLATGNLEAAKGYFHQGIAAATDVNSKMILSSIFRSLSEIHERNGDRDSALVTLKRHLDYARLIREEEMSRRLIGLKNKFQFRKYEDDLQQQIYRNDIQSLIIITSGLLLVLIAVIAFLLYRISRKKDLANKILSEKNAMIELQAKELEAANQELTALGRSKDKLFSIISHDLRSPFQIFLGNTEILLNDYDSLSNSERLEFIRILKETADNTYSLVENLLHLSASHTGSLEFKPVKIDLVPVIKDILRLYRPQALAKKVELQAKVPEGLEITADINMIRIILRNLINNAVKYSFDGSTVEVSASCSEQGILIAVKDNGMGMDQATIDSLFHIGTVTSQPGTSGERGTGLGLGLSREFVQKHGGNLEVHSEPGVGTVITISLPV